MIRGDLEEACEEILSVSETDVFSERISVGGDGCHFAFREKEYKALPFTVWHGQRRVLT